MSKPLHSFNLKFKRVNIFSFFLLFTVNLSAQNITTAVNGLNKPANNSVGLGGTLSNATTSIDFGSSNSASSIRFFKTTSPVSQDYFTILNGGNVGIGVSTPSEKLDVNGNASFNLGNTGYIKLVSGSGGRNGYIQSAFSNFLFSSNARYNGSTWVYDQAGPATQVQTESSAGYINLNIASSGSANSTINWNNAISIRNDATIRMSSLQSGLTPPAITGTTKMVITDQNGQLSYTDLPSGNFIQNQNAAAQTGNFWVNPGNANATTSLTSTGLSIGQMRFFGNTIYNTATGNAFTTQVDGNYGMGLQSNGGYYGGGQTLQLLHLNANGWHYLQSMGSNGLYINTYPQKPIVLRTAADALTVDGNANTTIHQTVNVNSLKTGITAPPTNGITKMVVTDADGLLSYKDIPSSTLPSLVSGNTIYVDKNSPNATDSRTGISKYSIDKPFKTIQAAVNSLSSNEVVWVKGGTYYESVHFIDDGGYNYINQTLVLENSGIIGGQTTLDLQVSWFSNVSVKGIGNAFILNNSGDGTPSLNVRGFHIENSLTIENVAIVNTSGTAAVFGQGNYGTTLRNVSISKTGGTGYAVHGSNLHFRECDISSVDKGLSSTNLVFFNSNVSTENLNIFFDNTVNFQAYYSRFHSKNDANVTGGNWGSLTKIENSAFEANTYNVNIWYNNTTEMKASLKNNSFLSYINPAVTVTIAGLTGGETTYITGNTSNGNINISGGGYSSPAIVKTNNIKTNLVNAAGDILYRDADGMMTNLAKGNTGQSLTVKSDGSLGWETLSGSGGGTVALPSTQVAYGSSGGVVTSSPNFTYNATNNSLGVAGTSASVQVGSNNINAQGNDMHFYSPNFNYNFSTLHAGTDARFYSNGYFNFLGTGVKVNALSTGGGAKMVIADAEGLLSTQTIPSGGGIASLPSNQVAYGSSSNTITGTSNLTFDGSTFAINAANLTPASYAPYKLAVNGNAIFTRVKVKESSEWADYVFEPGYTLPTLTEVEAFIKKHKHLPEVPSAADVKKEGIDVGDNQVMLLKKIEELTLYAIEQNKKIEQLVKYSSEQNKKIETLEEQTKTIEQLTKEMALLKELINKK